MRKLTVVLASLALMGLSVSARAGINYDLTIQNQTVNAGGNVALQVTWTSSYPVLKFLTTEFIITAVGSAPAGEVTFTNTTTGPGKGDPVFPPLNHPDYVFYGDSDDYITLPTTNPASVSTTNWSFDTYNFADSSNSNTDVPQDGTKLWTILNISTTGLAAGNYQITLGSSTFDFDTNTDQIPTFTGGLITVVPEPSTIALSMISVSALVVLLRRRNRISA